MQVRRRFSLLRLSIFGMVVFIAGCTGDRPPLSPISPSDVSPLPSPVSAPGATVSGVVTIDSAAPPAGLTLTVAGTDIAATVDSSGHFTLAGVPPGDIQLQLANAGMTEPLPAVEVAAQEQIQVTIAVSAQSVAVTSQQRASSTHRVGLRGLVTALGGSCSDLTFTIGGTTVVTNSATTFEDGPCSQVQNGTKVEVKGTRQSNGSVLATKVDIDTPHTPGTPPSDIEFKGSVSALGGTCPNVTFNVNGTAVTVNASTRFEDGSCATLQNGTVVEVKGISQSNGSVVATKVDIDTPHTPAPQPEIQVKGTIASLGGTCPNVTFSVNGTAVTVNASTRFEDGSCVTLQNGTIVEVKGTRQTDGSVLATKVDIDTPHTPAPEVEVRGTIASLSGICPNVTFNLNGTTVSANSSSRFEDGSCATLQNGTIVEVKGAQQTNGSVLAEKIDIDTPHTPPQPQVEVKGTVSSLGGGCPNITFSVNGTAVTVNASTRFEDGTCATVQNGTHVEVKGPRQANGSVMADKVDIDNPSPEVEVKGAISALGGACPAVTFTVNGNAVTANSTTRYEDGRCASLQNGTRVEVKGIRQTNGSILADKIEVDRR